MSISSIGGNNPAITSTQFSTTVPVSTARPDNDGDNEGVNAFRPAGGGGKFASAIDQALSQLGVSSSGSSSGTSSAAATGATQDPQQTMATFKQNLFAALQAQSGQSGSAASGSGSGTTSSVHGHHQHGGGGGKLEAGLQSLIQQISASSTSTADAGTASGSSSSSPAQDALQQSFNNLMAADGASGSNATLTSFLQTMAQKLHGAPPTGNVVSTTA